jgi:hypothetical protein
VTLTKLAESIRGVNSKLAAVQATTAELTLGEKQALLESLSKEVHAAASAADAPRTRLAAVSAAAASTNQRTKEAFKIAVRGLEALGMKIDAVAASGDISALDAKMKEQRWSDQRKIMLKMSL